MSVTMAVIGKGDLDMEFDTSDTEFREAVAQNIATTAASHVLAGMSRQDALEKAAQAERDAQAAMNDPTGTLDVELNAPPVITNEKRVAAIAAELMEPARDLAETI
ncbi:hypothetical protein QTI51_22910 [Variovorax sp. J22G73]|uniref:hypothetical protein n=1 Tax=unclassified Variovorax TaxID=663243 RepID=UPI002575FC73|nr:MULTISPECIES: hypothetical protein [unclassified Variovorax]MDM0007485.1 hypothetical protein [Variovorax sp. J22R203]MDM0100155.1 hypothetical protein [Variovorax sp. J22G73]